MPRWVKTLIALALLPVCFGAASALLRVISLSGSEDTTWVPLMAGACCWAVIYLLLPRPIWIYVVGHELTHAVWAWVFGARVKKFKASSEGGHVVISKSNFLIALAPYFFPIYAVLVVGVFVAGHLIWNWSEYQPVFHLLLGAAYAFHVTLTCHILKTRQSDITEQGYLFSGVIIFLGNVIVLLMAIPLLASKVSLGAAFGCWWERTGDILCGLGRIIW